ncbi:MAG TPA: hypothetical protein VEQ41_08835 [Solirubrobacterales bacterium]|nr:hypothetical protein [Solirubrobacterales bacterium]
MTKKELLVAGLLALVVLVTAVETAAAKGIGSMPAPGGVVVPGGEHRYIAISPGKPSEADELTVVAQVERRDGRLSRWWRLRGDYFVPAVTLDGTAGGLSADGETLILSRFTRQFPPRTSRFALLDTERRREPFRTVQLQGDFSFDAISPDGSTIYLIQRFPENKRADYITDYAVRAYDVADRRLLSEPIVDPSEPDEEMAGLPLSRASSPDGRWAYTLYDGNGGEPFVHALDTVDRTAVCIDLPQLAGVAQRHWYLFHLEMREAGQEIVVLKHDLSPAPAREVLTVDTESFEVEKASVEAAGVGGTVPWPAIGIVAALLLIGLVRIARRRPGPGAA